MKRSTKLAIVCAGAGTAISLLLPQAAYAGVVETRTFEGTGGSENRETGMKKAINEAKDQMGEFEAAQEQTCVMTEMHVKMDHILKKIPPVYVWKAELTADCY